jgi:hypothetical protein
MLHHDGRRHSNFESIAVGFPSGTGGATRAASIHTTQSKKLEKLNKVVGMHEYKTDCKTSPEKSGSGNIQTQTF